LLGRGLLRGWLFGRRLLGSRLFRRRLLRSGLFGGRRLRRGLLDRRGLFGRGWLLGRRLFGRRLFGRRYLLGRGLLCRRRAFLSFGARLSLGRRTFLALGTRRRFRLGEDERLLGGAVEGDCRMVQCKRQHRPGKQQKANSHGSEPL
jgi:hypothetical protein